MAVLWAYAGSPKGYTTTCQDVSAKHLTAVGWAIETKVAAIHSSEEYDLFDAFTYCTYEDVITYIYNMKK